MSWIYVPCALVLGPGDLLFSQSQSCFLINLQHQMQNICCMILTEPPWSGMGGGSCLLSFSKPLLWIFLSPMWDSGERDNGARKMGLTSDMYFGLGIKAAKLKQDERLKPTKYPTPGEWVNKMQLICTTEHCPAKPRNKLLTHATHLKITVLNERSQTQNPT